MRAHIALVSIIVALACRDAGASDSWATEVQQAVQTRTATAPSTRENWHAFSPDGIGMPLVMFGVYSAHQSIHMLAYVLTYRPLLEALAQKAREGVTVSVVVDYNENIANDRDGYIQRGLAYLARSGATVCATDQYKIMHSNRKPGGCYMALRGPVPEFASVDGAVARRHPKGRHEHEDVCHAVRGVEVHDFTTVTVLLVKCVDIDAFHIRHGNKT